MSVVRIATRGSALALAQAGMLASRIEVLLGVRTELIRVRTSGDRLRGPLQALGGKGLFVKEIEEAILEGRADAAVHSAKDLPARLAPGLAIAAVPARADPRDALVARGEAKRLVDLAPGARVGTGSARRAAQARMLRPDLHCVALRGNVDTRLRKLEQQELDALILACAGLDRLGLSEHISERIPPELLLPAVAQGALAVETREDAPLASELAPLDDPGTAAAVGAERAFLERLEGDCNVPLAAFAEPRDSGSLWLRGLLTTPDAGRVARAEAEGELAAPAALGQRVAERVLAEGGAPILESLRQEARG